MILTQQTCRQRSSRAAESKRRALENYFPERICYMFRISKCRGDWDLSLCTTSVLAFGEPRWNGKPQFFLRRNTFFFPDTPLRIGSRNASTEVVHRLRSKSPLHFDIRNKFTWKNNFLALGVCFPQPCSSAGRRFVVSSSHLRNYRRIVSFPQQKFRWNAL